MFHYTPQIHTLSINLKYVFYTSKRQSDFFMEEWKRKVLNTTG
ncbi:Protein-export protein secB (fragment) [Xenorhabdus cabanillasii JM26]|uniref:Protein-export protein secB n=1 Tax=Xenorhabdus cabanillasii JM26 TaxID=1427517 RepID=W1JBI1_9GAMM